MANLVTTSRPVRAERPARQDQAGCVAPAEEASDEAALSPATVAMLELYLGRVASVLRLDGWHVSVSPVPAEEDAVAQVDAPWGQRRAEVRVGAEFWASTPHGQRDALVHELLHLVLMPAWQMVDELLEQEMSSRTARVAWLGFTQHMEYSVDQLASVIAPQLDLPDFSAVAPQPA